MKLRACEYSRSVSGYNRLKTRLQNAIPRVIAGVASFYHIIEDPGQNVSLLHLDCRKIRHFGAVLRTLLLKKVPCQSMKISPRSWTVSAELGPKLSARLNILYMGRKTKHTYTYCCMFSYQNSSSIRHSILYIASAINKHINQSKKNLSLVSIFNSIFFLIFESLKLTKLKYCRYGVNTIKSINSKIH